MNSGPVAVFDRAALLGLLSRARSVVPSRTTIPIVASVLLTFEEGRVVVVASDLDSEYRDEAVCEVDQPGAVAVSAVQFHEAIRSLPDGAQVKINRQDDGRLKVSAGRSTFRLPCLPAGDFPRFTTEAAAAEGVLSCSTLARMLALTVDSASKDSTRYTLNSVLLEVRPGDLGGAALRAVATSGFRFAYCQRPVPPEFPPSRAILPAKAARLLQGLLAEQGGDVSIQLNERQFRFSAGTWVFAGKVVDGTYPDYERALPKEYLRELSIRRLDLLNGVRRTLIAAEGRASRVQASVEGSMMRLSVRSATGADAVEEVEVGYGGEPFEAAYVGSNLIDILTLLEVDDLTLKSSAAPKAVIFVDPSDDQSLFLTMEAVG